MNHKRAKIELGYIAKGIEIDTAASFTKITDTYEVSLVTIGPKPSRQDTNVCHA